MRNSKVSTSIAEGSEGMAVSSGAEMTRPILFHPWYGLATLLYMVGITLLSSIPGRTGHRNTLVEFGLNLGHIPLFAGLTILLIETIAPKRRQYLATPACMGAALTLMIFAAADEWHQAFVPGRSSSIMDFGLDMMGIGAVILFYRLSALVLEES